MTTTGCDYGDQDCRGGQRANSNLFGWSDDVWRTIGGTAAGAVVGIGVGLALTGTIAWGVLTAGACLLAVGAVAGAASGVVAYGLGTKASDRTTSGCLGSAALGGALGTAGVVAAVLAGKIASSLAGGVAPSVEDVFRTLAPGKNSHVRTVRSDAELEALYQSLTKGGTIFERPGYNGQWIRRPDGTTVGLRNKSGSGGRTIDVERPGEDPWKVHIDD
ncbi:MAG: hypothetical protein ACQEW8_07185 [Actinomycetota bacterium]